MKYPFDLNKKKIIVITSIKGIGVTKQFKFILDTGASKSIIDESVAFILGFDLQKLNTERLTTVGGGKNSKILKLPKLSLFGKDMVNFEVNVVEFPHQITYFADGLIGMDFLMRFKNIAFDFESKIVTTQVKFV
jgi:predicted aspartyl protease